MPRKNDFIDKMDKIIAANIDKARKISGQDTKELAREIGCTYQQFYKYLDGSSRITAGRLHMLAIKLGVPISSFFESKKG